MLKTFSRIDLVIYLQIYKSVLITSLTGFDIAFTNVEDTLKQRRNNIGSTLFQSCFNVVSTSGTNVVSTLCNVESPTSDFVSFSTSNVETNVETSLIRR